MRGEAQRELPQHYPQPGWVEHDAEEIWQASLATGARGAGGGEARRARHRRHRHHQSARDHGAVGARDRASRSHARSSGRTGARRTRCAALRARAATPMRCRRRPAWCSTPISPRPRSSGCSTTCTGARARAERGELAFGTIDSFLLWRLTGGKVHATDATNAARTLLFDIHRQEWDDELLALFRVPRAMLPTVRDCAGEFGATPAELFGAPIPIARHRRRSAGGDGRPGLLRAGHDQIDLRHRLLRGAQHGQPRRSPRSTGSSPPSPIASGPASPMRSRARSSSRAPRCSGCATGSA